MTDKSLANVTKTAAKALFVCAHGAGGHMDDRGMLRPGLAADITIFNPDTIKSMPEEVVHDLPAGAWRMRELATGVHYTIVNGQVLLEDGHHTGALPGRVLRNPLYQRTVG